MRALRAMLAALLLAACYPPLPTLVPTLGPLPTSAPVSALAASPTEPAPSATSTPPSSASPAPRVSPAPTAELPTPIPGTAAPSATPPPPTISLIFTGDINPGRCPAQIALAHDDFTISYQFVGETLRAADLAIGSLDGAISDQSAPSPCPETMNLIGPSRTVEGLTYAGFDLITVATNHAKDCGSYGWNCQERAFNDTLANLNAAGIHTVGGGADLAAARAPVILEAQGVRFAFLGVDEILPATWAGEAVPGTAPLSAETLPGVLADIAAARAQAEVVVVLAQWGVEYASLPTAYQQEWAAAMLAAGATLIIGNHPHTVQPVVETTTPEGNRAVVAYALGNFVFDQGPWENRQGVLLRATFTGAALTNYELLPIHIYSLYQPRFADPTEAAAILQRADPARLQ